MLGLHWQGLMRFRSVAGCAGLLSKAEALGVRFYILHRELRMTTFGFLLFFAAVMASLVTSCGGGNPLSQATSPGSGSGSRWLTLLKAIPDTSETRSYVELNDYAAVRAIIKIQPPSQDASPTQFEEYRARLSKLKSSPEIVSALSPSPMSGLGQYFDPQAWNKELGFNPANLDQDAYAGKPPRTYNVLGGRFDAKRIDSAIDTDPTAFRKMLSKQAYGGVTLYVWGEDQKQNVSIRDAVRPLGRGGRLAVNGTSLYWTYATDDAKAMVDAAQGKKPSLADAEDIKLLVGGIDRYSVYAVVLSNQGVTINPVDLLSGSSPESARQKLDAATKAALRPYQWLAIGEGQDAEGPYGVLTLLHADAKTAQENVGRLKAIIANGKSLHSQEAWSSLIRSSEVSADGRVLVARLRTTNSRLLIDALANFDSLLAHN